MTVCRRRPHSTWTTCRCVTCRADYQRTRKHHDAGLLAPSRADEAWDELVDLEREGWSATAVASAAGVSARAIQKAYTDMRHDRPHTISRTVADKILDRGTPTSGLVPALGATRRLQALSAQQWPLSELAARTGLAPMAVSRIRGGLREQLHATSDNAIRKVYRDLEMAVGPSPTARAEALARGWVPPLAWEDIDSPNGLADTA